MEMKICEIIGFAASLSVMWARVLAEARRDPWAGAGLAGLRRSAGSSRPPLSALSHPGRAERWARIPCHRDSYNYDK